MRLNRTKPWRRLACLRASRRRHAELAPSPPKPAPAAPLPPLESPDDDREFVPHPRGLALRFVPVPRPERA